MQKAAHAYLQTQVTTTSQGDILIMLYDGGIKFLNNAKERLAANDMAKKGILISKALDIINELDSTLNLEKGGDLASNLHNLYVFCSNRLLMANLKKDPKIIDEVLLVLSGLRSAYAEINSLPEAIAAGQEAAANQHAKAFQPTRPTAPAPATEAAPLPGAGARARLLYAQRSSEVASAQAGTAEEAPLPHSAAYLAQAGTATNAGAAPASPAAQADFTAPPRPLSEAPGASEEKPVGFGVPGSFSGKALSGSSLYRKFAG